jgi:hypothetical protein
MKQGVIQRNGSATSPYGVMTEHFFRHGLMMTLFWSVDDPVYLEEPMVRTHSWRLNTGGFMGAGAPFESVDELGDKPLGWVPFWPLGSMQTDFAEQHNLPLKATLGGRENLYPEYMQKIEQYRQEEAAAKAAQAAKAPVKK